MGKLSKRREETLIYNSSSSNCQAIPRTFCILALSKFLSGIDSLNLETLEAHARILNDILSNIRLTKLYKKLILSGILLPEITLST